MNKNGVNTAEFQTFVGGHDSYVDKNLNCEELINFYIEPVASGRKANQFVLRPTEGSKKIREMEAPIRAFYATSRGFNGANESAIVCVAGSKVYADWKEVKGNLKSETGQVDITDNGYQVFICDGKDDGSGIVHGDAYSIDFGQQYDSAFSPTLKTLEDMPMNPTHCTQCGPYTCISGTVKESGADQQNSSRFYFSNVAGVKNDNNELEIIFPGDKFEGSVSFYNPIRNLISQAGFLWLFGDNGYEAWQATGNFRQEFQRVQGMFASGYGLVAEWSLKSNGEQIFWLGTGDKGNGICWGLGFGSAQPARLSLASLEEEWAGYPDLAQAIGSVYSAKGHSFYLLTFPISGKTFVFDLATKTWHKRHFYNGSELTAWKPFCTQTIKNKTYACAIGEKNVYELTEPCYGDDGAPTYRKRVAPCYNVGLVRSIHYELALDLQSGREYQDGEESKFMLRYSDDGGYNWTNPMIQSNGGRGEYAKILQFRRLGQARKRVYELSMVDPVGVNIAGARLTTQLSSMRL